MAIQFSCPHCGARLSVPEALAGAQGRCKGCGDVVAAPAPAQSAADATAKESPTADGSGKDESAPPRRKSRRPLLPMAGVGAAAVAVIVGAIWWHNTTTGLGLKVRQSQEEPRWLIVDCPWKDLPQPTIRVTYVEAGKGRRPGSLFFSFEEIDPETLQSLLSTTKKLREKWGIGTLYMRLTNFEVAAVESHSGKTGCCVLSELHGPAGRKRARARIGAMAAYFNLDDWSSNDTGLLAIKLHDKYFKGRGSVCVWLVSSDGEKLGRATCRVSLKE